MSIVCCADTVSGPLLLYKSLDWARPEMLRVAGYAVRLYLLVGRGDGKSTRDLQLFRLACHPGNPFLAGLLSGLHHIVERPGRNSTSRRDFYFSRWVPRPCRVLCDRAEKIRRRAG